ncbi:solute carrier family 35 member G1-like [Brevipalpus obovatus]|uniref:solute carrier family 35 member G1-like n=1 Tax=Brevipalpus obovatus TaxID=246614 RepID=UPI003D9F27D3
MASDKAEYAVKESETVLLHGIDDIGHSHLTPSIIINNPSQDSQVGECPNSELIPMATITNTDQIPLDPLFWTNFRGVFFALVSSTFFAFIGVLVKFATDVQPPLIALGRFFIMAILATASIVSVSGQGPVLGPKDAQIWLILRGVTGAMGMYLRYQTIQLLPLANAMVLILTVPVFTTIFARFCFQEICSLFHVIAIVIALIGVALTADLSYFFHYQRNDSSSGSSPHVLGVLCGIAAALVQTSTTLLVRHLKGIHFAIILFTSSWIAVIELIFITYFLGALKVPETVHSALLISAIGVLSYFGQILFTKALSVEEAGIISMVQCSMDLFLAFLLQITIFKVVPDIGIVIGSLMVFSSVLIISFRKYILSLPEQHHLRANLAFLIK